MKAGLNKEERILLINNLLIDYDIENIDSLYNRFVALSYPLSIQIFAEIIFFYHPLYIPISELLNLTNEFYQRFNKRKFLTYNSKQKFYTWYYTILKNFFIEKIRTIEREQKNYLIKSDNSYVDIIETIRLNEINNRIKNTNTIEKEIYELKYHYNFTQIELASLYHCSISTIKRRINYYKNYHLS